WLQRAARAQFRAQAPAVHRPADGQGTGGYDLLSLPPSTRVQRSGRQWGAAVQAWQRQNAPLIQHLDGQRQPAKAHEYMLYQALIGAWPELIDKDFVERMRGYALKAAREAKQETSWTNPNVAYEAALHDFVGNLLDARISAEFLASFGEFAARTALLGALNGL